MPSGMRHRPSVAEKCDTRASRVVAARLGYMWRKSKQVERAACDRLLADMGTVLQYRGELSEIGPVLTRLVGRGDGVVMPSVQHFALQQQMASLTATVADHEDAILELERQVASLEPGVQSLDTKVRELGVLLSESMSVVEDRIKVMDEDRISELERKVSGVCCWWLRRWRRGCGTLSLSWLWWPSWKPGSRRWSSWRSSM